jgi:[protein-PII] uridylyltransferase
VGTGPPGPGLRARRAEVLARPGLTGRALWVERAAATDRWLTTVFAAATGGGPVHDVALLAVGGYGRRELAPGSDLDLVLVHRSRADVETVAQAVWYPIWDEGMALDHSVRTPRDVGAVMDADRRVALGRLDVRTVAGSAALGEEVRAAALDKWAARRDRWFPEVAAAVAERHRRAGDLAFLLEPDLKEARGGLRDVHLLTALARVTPVLADLVAEGRLDPPAVTLTAARAELQRLTGRPANRLGLQDQDGVAAALGLDAEHLAAGLAEAARTVAWSSDDAWRRIGTPPPRRFGRRSWAPQPLEPGLVLRHGEVTLDYRADPAVDVTLALRAAAVSAELDLPIARSTIDRFTDSAAADPAGPWPDDLRQTFLRLLGAGRPAIAAFETLVQQGVIVRILPEWQTVRNKPQRNAYHRFTVDRHLLETVANATTRVRTVTRPDLLLLGALLHDIGKGHPGDHTEAGVEVVAALGPRLGLGPADVATLQRLIRHHLLLPEAATRRDLDDPATVDAVADAVGDRETLDLLAALVEADSRATGPAAWGRWKAGLVGTLVARAARRLDGHPPPAVPPPSPDEQRLLDGGRLAVRGEGHRLTVVAPDGPGLLAVVAGVLAVDGARVRSASTRAGPDPTGGAPGAVAPAALIVLDVAPAWDVLPDVARVEADIAAALAGDLDVAARLADRERSAPRRPPLRRAADDGPTVVVTTDSDTSDRATIVEVRAPDTLGTLWRIATVLGRAGLTITAALATTLGADVVDTFYVLTERGDKLSAEPGRAEAVCAALVDALTAG